MPIAIDRRFWVLMLFTVVSCKKASVVADAGAPNDEEPRPVYAANFVADPVASLLCGLLHRTPEKRREACCGEKPGSGVVERECVRMLSQALADRVVTVSEGALSTCELALAKALEGCDWPGPAGFEVPEVCAELIEGTSGEKARCRSSLECRRGLRCVGVGPTDWGRCVRPSPENTLCAISVDALASASLQRLEHSHPECEGTCGGRRCESALDAGAGCTKNIECGAGRHCGGSKGCVVGASAGEGDACVQGACGVGLRCLQGSCKRPATRGTACKTDQECTGACVAGRCAPRCTTR